MLVTVSVPGLYSPASGVRLHIVVTLAADKQETNHLELCKKTLPKMGCPLHCLLIMF